VFKITVRPYCTFSRKVASPLGQTSSPKPAAGISNPAKDPNLKRAEESLNPGSFKFAHFGTKKRGFPYVLSAHHLGSHPSRVTTATLPGFFAKLIPNFTCSLNGRSYFSTDRLKDWMAAWSSDRSNAISDNLMGI
jgi:hypothetical protein